MTRRYPEFNGVPAPSTGPRAPTRTNSAWAFAVARALEPPPAPRGLRLVILARNYHAASEYAHAHGLPARAWAFPRRAAQLSNLAHLDWVALPGWREHDHGAELYLWVEARIAAMAGAE